MFQVNNKVIQLYIYMYIYTHTHTYIYIYIKSCQILFHYKLLQDIEYSSLCCIVGLYLCCLSILYIVLCIY